MEARAGIALTLLLLPGAARSQDPPPPPLPGKAAEPHAEDAADLQDPAAALRHLLTGDFVAVERHRRRPGETGEGHIRAWEAPGGRIARLYWSEGGGRRIYAGTDVLEIGPDRRVRHWWFGSRGDEAYAEGTWEPEARRLVLVVRDGDGDPDRRYTYEFAADGRSFHFQNDHYGGGGYRYEMDADYRRAPLDLPADLRVRRLRGDDVLERYTGAFEGRPEGFSRGRLLFGDWLLLETEGGHAVAEERSLGRGLRLWWWRAGEPLARFHGREKGRSVVWTEEGGAGRLRIDRLLPRGWSTVLQDASGRVLEPRRDYLEAAGAR